MAMDQYLLIPFLVGWTSIYQLFWCELQGYKVLTHCHMSAFEWPSHWSEYVHHKWVQKHPITSKYYIIWNPMIWVNYNDLTATSLESWLIRGIIPQMALNSGWWIIIIYPEWWCSFPTGDTSQLGSQRQQKEPPGTEWVGIWICSSSVSWSKTSIRAKSSRFGFHFCLDIWMISGW